MPRPSLDAHRLLAGRVYSIAVVTGNSLLTMGRRAAEAVPVLTRESIDDHLSVYVADPFMIREDGRWYLFFESLAWRPGTKKGEIAHATSDDGLRWKYRGIVLSEPFHLSYPYVFRSGSDHYMVPESSAAGAVRLYRGDPFPSRWTLVGELLRGPVLLDNSLFERDGSWWMLSHTDVAAGTLGLFHSPRLTGPWVEHPMSPVVRGDLRIARPAGRVVAFDGRLIRFAQDCRATYGSSVSALEIAELSRDRYREVEVEENPILSASGRGWNREGMHQIDPHLLEDGSWMACVDGWSYRLRRPRELLRWALDRWA